MQAVQMKAGADRAVLTLMGDVGFEITASAVAAALKGAGEAPLTISLHSYGGDALAGIAIHNMLARHPGAKTVVVEGVAASAASLIAMAGDRIVMPANAFMMIHEAWGGAMGDASTMREQADVLDMISGAYRRTYAMKSGMSEADVAVLMAAETWFTAEDAVAQGFATEAAEPVEVRAHAAPEGRFSRMPEALRAPKASSTLPAMPAPLEEVPVTETTIQAGAEPVAPAPAPAPAVASIADIKAIAGKANLGSDFILSQVERFATLDQVRDAALEAAVRAAPRAVQPGIQVTDDEKPRTLARFSGALAANMVGRAPAEAEREFAGMGFLRLAQEVLIMGGERNVHRLNPSALIERIMASTHSTSDFANVLANSTNKVVRDLYMGLPNNWSSWCEEIEVDDFKTITIANVGSFPEVVETGAEGGPITMGTIGEEAETFAVTERGRLLGLTRQAMINDDTRAFQRVVQGAAMAGYTALRRAVFKVLTDNANMADGTALFASGHSNLGTAGAMTATTYGELRSLLFKMSQPSRSGMSPAAAPLPPPTSVALITGPDKERTALELLGNTIVPTALSTLLPESYKTSTSLVADAFLNTGNTPYYLARTEAGMRAIEIAYLRGARTPSVTSAERIDFTGMTFRCLFDFGVKAGTWRTIAANLG